MTKYYESAFFCRELSVARGDISSNSRGRGNAK